MANDTVYGLASAVFTENVGKAIRVAHALEAGTTWVRTFCAHTACAMIDFSTIDQLLSRFDSPDSFRWIQTVREWP